jgi:hypothetical protein
LELQAEINKLRTKYQDLSNVKPDSNTASGVEKHLANIRTIDNETTNSNVTSPMKINTVHNRPQLQTISHQ